MLAAGEALALLSLRAKFVAVNLFVVASALITTLAVVAGSEWQHAKGLLLEDLQTQAQALGESASIAVAANDRRGAEETLRALRLSPYIREGALFDARRSEIASYRRPGRESELRESTQTGGNSPSASLFDISESIRVNGEVVGYILVRADLDFLRTRLHWKAAAVVAAVALALLLALVLSLFLGEVVVGPIQQLALVIRKISSHGDYGCRARVYGLDEVATLARSFNSMIEQVERRHEALIHELEQRRKVEEQLDHLAHFDALTGLPNRRHFHNRIEAAVGLSTQFEEPVSLMFIDLDNFKNVNDTLGHDVGDELLRYVAQTLVTTLRANDIVCRLGGDEFAVIIEGGVDEQLLAGVATKLIDALARPVEISRHSVQVGCSIGVARCPVDCTSAEDLLRAADAAMYDAKASGKNTFRFYCQTLQEHTERRLHLEGALRQAVCSGNGFYLLYQPVWSVTEKCIVAVEALCRWRHPELGGVLPGEFIPIAEECGLILPLGQWILRTACLQGVAWRRNGHSLAVAVNVSGRQVRDPGFFDRVCRVLEETGLPPELLEIEVAESALRDGFSDLVASINKLRDLGVRMVLDDFGILYSSLNCLRRLPIDKLKIDRSFVRDLPADVDGCFIARAIVALGHSLNLTVQAEGVEERSQQEYLADLGCEYIQGHHVGRPLAAEDLTELLTRPWRNAEESYGRAMSTPSVRIA